MKEIKWGLLVIFISLSVSAQRISYGLKGGTLYNFKGKLKEIGKLYSDKGSGNIGWQIGGYARISLPLLHLQPELSFTKFSRNYQTSSNEAFEEKISKLDLPMLVGFYPFVMTRLYIGPVLSFNLNSKATLKNISNYKGSDFNMGLQVGVGIDFSRLSFYFRWETSVSPSEIKFVQESLNTRLSIDNRPSMLLLTESYRL
ncbi:outer membrane beta-barrel protein [Bacteroidetes bacterium endosymbiont of Geopemphigus sp.]|uniref:outer membrane beta-barrel protein n=1 Tax=Bacteroidetes bacterium endosymbiont of Geopemphigus sp. TaxID=2047937 RepID=UPI000CD28E70|nr:outer membrane beta-barrel protein [Bacteroidetes bacterium endosymbiont of Geopemphigus sp.]